jgi:hypothetical protein
VQSGRVMESGEWCVMSGAKAKDGRKNLRHNPPRTTPLVSTSNSGNIHRGVSMRVYDDEEAWIAAKRINPIDLQDDETSTAMYFLI